MWNVGLDEAQAGISIAGRNINNLRYEDNTTLLAESEEELKRLLMKVKEESEKADFKLNIQKTKIMAPGPFMAVGPLMDQNLVVWSRRWESERRKEDTIPWVMQPAFALQGISQK